MGRKKGRNNVQISISIPVDLIEKIEQYAFSKRLPRSKVITMAIEYFLSHPTETSHQVKNKNTQNDLEETYVPQRTYNSKKVHHSKSLDPEDFWG